MLVSKIQTNQIQQNKLSINKPVTNPQVGSSRMELPKGIDAKNLVNITFCGGTDLTTAAYNGNLDAVCQELENGTDVNFSSNIGYTALHHAVHKKDENIVEELLAHPDINVNTETLWGDTALTLAVSESIAKRLIQHPNINVNAKNKNGRTALIAHCKEGNESIVKVILEHPDVDINIRDNSGHTAIDYAKSHRYTKIKKMLENYKRGVDRRTFINTKLQKTPVDIIKLSPEENIWTDEEITKRFTKFVTDQDYDKALDMLYKTPLINLDEKLLNKICSTGNAKFTEKVFDYKFHKQKPMLEEYEQKRKVFIESTVKNLSYDELKENNAALNTLDGFKILMSKPEFNPNDSYEKRTLFERACIIDPEGNLASSILSKYDDVFVNNAKKTRNSTIKSLIEDYEKVGKFKIKLENIKSKLSNAQTRETAVESLNEFVSSDGFKPEMTDSVGNDVLHIIAGVASDGTREIIQKILDKGGNVDSINIGKQTPIMSAIKGLMIAKTEDEKSGLLSNIKFLLDKGADVDAQDLNDQTVFHYVCRTLSVALLMMFLAKSPNVFINDKYGNRAAKYLQSKEMQDVYQKYIMG